MEIGKYKVFSGGKPWQMQLDYQQNLIISLKLSNLSNPFEQQERAMMFEDKNIRNCWNINDQIFKEISGNIENISRKTYQCALINIGENTPRNNTHVEDIYIYFFKKSKIYDKICNIRQYVVLNNTFNTEMISIQFGCI